MSAFRKQVLDEIDSITEQIRRFGETGPSSSDLEALRRRASELVLTAVSFKARAEAPGTVYNKEMVQKVIRAWESAQVLQAMAESMEARQGSASDGQVQLQHAVAVVEMPVPSSPICSADDERFQNENAAAAEALEALRMQRQREHETRMAEEDAQAKERHRLAAQAERDLRKRLADEKEERARSETLQNENKAQLERRGAAMRRSQAARVPLGSVHHVESRSDLVNKLASGSTAVVVDWFAPWCGPCRNIAPYFEQLATREFTDVLFMSVDTERPELHGLAQSYSVGAFPTFDIYLDGQKLQRIVGADPNKVCCCCCCWYAIFILDS